jgi:hypothetical protein
MHFHFIFFNALIISVLSACISFKEGKMKIFKAYQRLIQTAGDTIPEMEDVEEGLIVRRIEGGILPIQELFNQLDQTELMIEMAKMMPENNDLLFLLIFWFSYDTDEHLIFSKYGIEVLLKTLKLYSYPNSIVTKITLNFKRFLLEKLASFSEVDQASKFLDAAVKFAHPFLYKFCFGFFLEQNNTGNFEKNTQATFDLLQTILEIGSFPLLFNELANFHVEAIPVKNLDPNPDLIQIICYIKLKYRNSIELLGWLNITPNFQVFYFFFLQMLELQNDDADLKKYLRNSFIVQRRVAMGNFVTMFGDFFTVSPHAKGYTLHVKEGTEDTVKAMIEKIFNIINLVDIKEKLPRYPLIVKYRLFPSEFRD